MGIFKNFARRAVETVTATAQEVTTEVAEDKVSLWSGIATIGIFAGLTYSSFKRHVAEQHPPRDDHYSTITVNNYYYRTPHRPRRKN